MLANLHAKNENPALARGAFGFDQSKQHPVNNTYTVGARSEQLAAKEDFIDTMIPCFLAYSALLACRVWDGHLALPKANAMAMRLADKTGLTLALRREDVEVIFTDEFLYSLDDAACDRTNQAAAHETYISKLILAFESHCRLLVCRVRQGEIAYMAAADDACEFARSNGLSQLIGVDRVQRIMAVAFSSVREAA